jgi:type II secretory pathway pseudopilin PulG
MRRRSRCRGYTCIELAVTLGVVGSLIIVLTGVVVREAEKLYTRRAPSCASATSSTTTRELSR